MKGKRGGRALSGVDYDNNVGLSIIGCIRDDGGACWWVSTHSRYFSLMPMRWAVSVVDVFLLKT